MSSNSFTFPNTSQTGDKKTKVILSVLPKIPSNESLSNSPGPASPGKYYEHAYISEPPLYLIYHNHNNSF